MPKIVAAYLVTGALNGLLPDGEQAQLTAKFIVLDDGSLLGLIHEPPFSSDTESDWFVENGKAAIDHCESTQAMQVYTCRFTLAHCDSRAATRVHCVGRLSWSKGFIGRWWRAATTGGGGNSDDAEDVVVAEIPLHLPPLHHTASIANKRTPEEAVEVPVILPLPGEASPARTHSRGPPRNSVMKSPAIPSPPPPPPITPTTETMKVPACCVFRGETVDSDGQVYLTTLSLKFLSGHQVTGTARESGRTCPITGTRKGSLVKYRLTYPHTKTVTYYYNYEGKLCNDGVNGKLRPLITAVLFLYGLVVGHL